MDEARSADMQKPLITITIMMMDEAGMLPLTPPHDAAAAPCLQASPAPGPVASPPPPASKHGSGVPTVVYAAVAAIGGTVAVVAAAAVYVVRSRRRARVGPAKDAAPAGGGVDAPAAVCASDSGSNAAQSPGAVHLAHSSPRRVDGPWPAAAFRPSSTGTLPGGAAIFAARLAFAPAPPLLDDGAMSDSSVERLSATGSDKAGRVCGKRALSGAASAVESEDDGIGRDNSYGYPAGTSRVSQLHVAESLML
jgi:hypothetical protein